jgi:hypothetical protein
MPCTDGGARDRRTVRYERLKTVTKRNRKSAGKNDARQTSSAERRRDALARKKKLILIITNVREHDADSTSTLSGTRASKLEPEETYISIITSIIIVVALRNARSDR